MMYEKMRALSPLTLCNFHTIRCWTIIIHNITKMFLVSPIYLLWRHSETLFPSCVGDFCPGSFFFENVGDIYTWTELLKRWTVSFALVAPERTYTMIFFEDNDFVFFCFGVCFLISQPQCAKRKQWWSDMLLDVRFCCAWFIHFREGVWSRGIRYDKKCHIYESYFFFQKKIRRHLKSLRSTIITNSTRNLSLSIGQCVTIQKLYHQYEATCKTTQ